MSIRELLAGGGGVKSIQTGYAATSSLASGSGEDTRYLDVTISSVVPAKCDVTFVGGGIASGSGAGNTMVYSQNNTSGNPSVIFSARVTSSTNLRIAHNSASPGHLAGRWTVVEYK